MHSFTVDKPKNFQAAFRELRSFAEKNSAQGVKLDGDEQRGTLSASGVVGDYVVGQEAIEITIRKKPAFLPNKMIENEIRKMFLMAK